MRRENKIGSTVSVLTSEQVAEKALAATVYLEMRDRSGEVLGIGSGFFVEHNLIATNFHVIEGAMQGTAKLVGEYRQYTIEGITAADKQNDLAILKVTAFGVKPLPLGESDNVKIGATVYVTGNPKGLEGTFSDGIISRLGGNNEKRLQMTAPISPGSSGGPVLNNRGEVIGVSFAGHSALDAQNLNFAIPSNYLRRLIDASGTVRPLLQVGRSVSAETYFNRGCIKHEQADYKGAIADFDEAIRLKPDFVIAYAVRGVAHQHMEQYLAAIADYDEAIRLESGYTMVYSNRGLAKDRLGQHLAAIADYDEAIRLSPDLAETYANRGLAKRNLGQMSSANDDFRIALRLAEQDDDEKLKAQIEEMCEHFKTQTIPDDALAYHNRGLVKCGRGQYAAAIVDFDMAIQLKPDYVDAYFNRGTAKSDIGQYSAAISDFDTVIQLRPDDYQAYHNRGEAKSEQGQYFAAISDYEMAIQIKPDYALAYLARGVVRAKLDQHIEAISDFDMAIQLKPDFALAYYNRGAAYVYLDRTSESNNDFQTALRLAEEAGDKKLKDEIEERCQYLEGRAVRNEALAYYKQGCTMSELGEHAAAIVNFDMAIQLKPDYAEAYYGRGNAKGNLDQHIAAITDYDMAIQLKFDCAEIYHNRGLIKNRIDLYVAAISDFDRSIQLDPDNPSAYLQRGVAKFFLNRRLEARQDFLTAWKLVKQTGDEALKSTIETALQHLEYVN